MEYKKQFDEGAGLMMMASFHAISESTGQRYTGFSMCSAEWDYKEESFYPAYEDMVDHFYCNPIKYGYELGPLNITNVKFDVIHPRDNLLLNMN